MGTPTTQEALSRQKALSEWEASSTQEALSGQKALSEWGPPPHKRPYLGRGQGGLLWQVTISGQEALRKESSLDKRLSLDRITLS